MLRGPPALRFETGASRVCSNRTLDDLSLETRDKQMLEDTV